MFLVSLRYTEVYQIRIKNFIKFSKFWMQKTLGAQRAEKPAGPMAAMCLRGTVWKGAFRNAP